MSRILSHTPFLHSSSGPVGKPFKDCQIKLTMDCVSVLFNELKPSLNTKDEYRSQALV